MTDFTTLGLCFSSTTDHTSRWALTAIALLTSGLLVPSATEAQIRATARPGATPLWNNGIQQISPESYYNAIECGKQGGADPACVFWDTGLCENDDFTLAAFTGYKQVSYEVWAAVRRDRPAPQPNYQAARRTRVTITATPADGSDNVLTDLVLTRGGTAVRPVERSIRNGRFTWDYDAWSPAAAVTLDMVGETRTISCTIPVSVLAQFR